MCVLNDAYVYHVFIQISSLYLIYILIHTINLTYITGIYIYIYIYSGINETKQR